MSQVALLLRALGGPLLLDPRLGPGLISVFQRKLAGASFSGADLHAELGLEAAVRRASPAAADQAIAVIPIYGVIAQHLQSLGTGTEQIGAAFDLAVASKGVSGILLDVDSPGGTVAGVPELATKIAAARGTKPILALANALAASAAYWIASAADEVMVAPSGETGSIGVYTVHEDWSKALEQEGVTVTPVVAGKYKTELAKWGALSEEGLAELQARVDEVYGWFIKAVAANRGDTQANVRAGYGQGRILGAEQSVKANLADRVGTFEDAILRLATRIGRAGGSGGRRADLLRRRLTLDAPTGVSHLGDA